MRDAYPVRSGGHRPAGDPVARRVRAGRHGRALSFDGQPAHDVALYGIAGSGTTGHAGAQEFVSDGSRLTRVSLYLSSRAGTGTVDVQVRGVRDDPASAVASARVDLSGLGGPGAGWVEVPLEAALRPGATYYLFAQAATAGGGRSSGTAPVRRRRALRPPRATTRSWAAGRRARGGSRST